MKKNSSAPGRSLVAPGGRLRRLAIYGVLGVALLYLVGALAGYYWMHFARKNDQVGFTDVALLRWREVRRGVAVQQFAKAQREWEAKNHQAAYLAYVSAVRNDPDNVPGRLSAAKFLVAAGGATMAVTMLEDGLARAPDDRRLIEQTFDLLLLTGRDKHALELLRKRPAPKASDPNGQLLQIYQIRATLTAEDANAARKLLDQHPELTGNREAAPVIARVWWETKERKQALELLTRYLQAQSAVPYSSYVQLAQWQLGLTMTDEAVLTAQLAVKKYPGEIAPRLLLIEALAAKTFRGPEWQREIEGYLKDFSERPEALGLLADLSGQNGWVELARALYDLAAVRQADLRILALSYSDALVRSSRFREAREVLAEVEAQAAEANAPFNSALRQRQVIIGAALGDREGTRESARRMAAVLRNDPDRLEIVRRQFAKLGIAEAVAELSSSSLSAKISARK